MNRLAASEGGSGRASPRGFPVLAYCAKRIGFAASVLFLASVLIFALTGLLPGDILTSRLGNNALPEQYAALERELGLDKPWWQRYQAWISGFVGGDWGMSWVRGEPVRELVLARLRNSLALAAMVLAILLPLSIGSGVLAGLREGSWFDRAVTGLGAMFLVVPDLIVGVLLLLVFSVVLRWFPISATPPTTGGLCDHLRVLILPALPAVISWYGYLSRLARAGTLDVVHSPYVRTAVMKGISQYRVICAHILRNALPATLSVALLCAGAVIGGLLVSEQIFSYPGIGKLLLEATIAHDVPVLLAGTMLLGGIMLTAIMLADALLLLLDPRAREGLWK